MYILLGAASVLSITPLTRIVCWNDTNTFFNVRVPPIVLNLGIPVNVWLKFVVIIGLTSVYTSNPSVSFAAQAGVRARHMGGAANAVLMVQVGSAEKVATTL